VGTSGFSLLATATVSVGISLFCSQVAVSTDGEQKSEIPTETVAVANSENPEVPTEDNLEIPISSIWRSGNIKNRLGELKTIAEPKGSPCHFPWALRSF
jgi:hypothetical protein